MIFLPSCKLLKLQSKIKANKDLYYAKYICPSQNIKKWRTLNYQKEIDKVKENFKPDLDLIDIGFSEESQYNEFVVLHHANLQENTLYACIKHWLMHHVFHNDLHRNTYFTQSIMSKVSRTKINIQKFCEALSKLDNDNYDENCFSGTIFIDNEVQYHYMIGDDRLIACVTKDMTIEYFESITLIPNYEKRGRDFYIDGYKVTSPMDYPNCENRIPFDGSEYQGFLTEKVIPLLSILFFAEIETKVIQSENKKRENKHNGIKNSTNIPIEIINSNWFTNIIRTNGFSVNGHFRFQACGDGMKNHKLIWINDFEKQGYTRIARKELSNII